MLLIESPEQINLRINELTQNDENLSKKLVDLAEQIASAGISKNTKALDKLKREQVDTRQSRADLDSELVILNRRLETARLEFAAALKVERRATFNTLLPEYEAAALELAEAEIEAREAALQIHHAAKRFDSASQKATHLKDSLQRVASEFGLEIPTNLSNTSWIGIDVSGVKMQDLLLNLIHISGRYSRTRRALGNFVRLDSFLED